MDGSIQYEIKADSSQAVSATKAQQDALKSLNQEAGANAGGLRDLAARLDAYQAKQRGATSGTREASEALRKLNDAHAEHSARASQMVGRLDALMGGQKAATQAAENLTASTAKAAEGAAAMAGALGAGKAAASEMAEEAAESGAKVAGMSGALAAVPAKAAAATSALAAIATAGAAIAGVALGVKLLRDGAESLSKAEYVTEEQQQSLRGFVFAVDGVGRAVDRAKQKVGELAASMASGAIDYLSGGEMKKAGETLQAADLVNERTKQMRELIALEEELKDRQRSNAEKLTDRQGRASEITAKIEAMRSAPERGTTEGPKQELEITKLEKERAELNLEIYELQQRLASERKAPASKTANTSDMLTGQMPADMYQSPDWSLLDKQQKARDENGRFAPAAADDNGDGLVTRAERRALDLDGGPRREARNGRIRGYQGPRKSLLDQPTGFDLFAVQQARKAREAQFAAGQRAPRGNAADAPRGGGDELALLSQIREELRRIRTS